MAVVTGDLNVAHREDDLKNWKGNLRKSGFLPEERSRFDTWFAAGEWVDVHRAAHGPGPGPYTWWSWRGQAFDNDSGWRIDYQLASRPLADRARGRPSRPRRGIRPALVRPRGGDGRLRPRLTAVGPTRGRGPLTSSARPVPRD